jgi:hypothetical protein
MGKLSLGGYDARSREFRCTWPRSAGLGLGCVSVLANGVGFVCFLSGAQTERRLGMRVWFRTTMHSPQDFFVLGTIGVEHDGFERN